MSIQQQILRIGTHDIKSFLLTNRNGMVVELMSWGATLVDVCVPDRNGIVESVALAQDNMNAYEANSTFLGCVVGRVAGRIANSRFYLNGQEHILLANSGAHHLHGGSGAMWQQPWQVGKVVDERDYQSVTFEYVSHAGENNYPGTLSVSVTYILTENNTLSIRYCANTDTPTLCNLTNHVYFNLSGNVRHTVHQHLLEVDADAVCAMSDDLIVTGEEWAVSGSVFDCRMARPLSEILEADDKRIQLALGVDHYFILNHSVTVKPQIKLYEPISGRRLCVSTNQPCVVLYTHNHANGEQIRHGVIGRQYDALCIETQKLPHKRMENGDHPAALYPEHQYVQHTDFHFDVVS